MDAVRSLLDITPSKEYEAALLPRQVVDRLRSMPHPVEVSGPVDALCDLRGERWVIRTHGKTFRVIPRDGDFQVFADPPRHYAASALPVLKGEPGEADGAVLLALYSEVCAGWRSLTDVRFKLLALVPAVSVIAWLQLLSSKVLATPAGALVGAGLCVVGAVVTALLRVYDLRNDGLYDELISRGRKIETELGVDTGLFAGRPRAVDTLINHSVPLRWIYRLAIAGWLALGLWFALIAGGVVDLPPVS